MLGTESAPGVGGTQICSSGLVKSLKQVTTLQKCRTAHHRDVNLTVISGQFWQQIRFKRRPEQTTCNS